MEFYFDFASPYAYFASGRIDAIAARHGRQVAWRPFMLGQAFVQTGMVPATEAPLRGDYVRHELARTARWLGLPFVLPEGFPMTALAPSRVYYWLLDRNVALAKDFAIAVFDAYFGDGRNMADVDEVADVAATLGVAREDAIAAAGDPAIKARFKAETEAALAKGAFGSPYFIVDGEPFWGADRLDQIEQWLETGGW
jgi:2-hydroxychromene-2-carboxylate isomerase